MRNGRLSGKSILLGLLLVVGIFVVVSCSKGSETTEGQATGSTTAAEPTIAVEPPAEPAQLSPDELGQQIGRLYMEAMREARDLVQGLPPAAELRPRLEAAFENRVQALVAFGHQREAMDEAGRAAVDSRLSRILMFDAERELGSLAWMSEANTHYMATDPDIASKIIGYNIITQYANFDLLRRQAPAEAQRLGLAPAAAVEPTAAPVIP